MQKLETIFEADFAEITLKIITETKSEKNMENNEESQFLFFIRNAFPEVEYEWIGKNELNEQEKLLKKIRTVVPSVEDDTSKLREWIALPGDDL
ncbi:hypothetical protein Glove_78g170 [Diversispora epigaea]|uniref:Uncharacterized protein n=1 Tax=Diversispora epigaea TaxID=1348612 RepID=A0A397JJN1_9GLOM|nr:hypothetical protein Glove_78g170 [Diversispora epigaea]